MNDVLGDNIYTGVLWCCNLSFMFIHWKLIKEMEYVVLFHMNPSYNIKEYTHKEVRRDESQS